MCGLHEMFSHDRMTGEEGVLSSTTTFEADQPTELFGVARTSQRVH